MKKTYQSPITDMFSFRLESQLLGISNVTTTDPKDGGDPTASGRGSVPGAPGEEPKPNEPNPFDQFGAKAGLLDQDDFNVWK